MIFPIVIVLFLLFTLFYHDLLFGTLAAGTGVFLLLLGLIWISLIIMEHLFRPKWQAKQQILKRHLTPGKAAVLLVLACLITGSIFVVLVDPLILAWRGVEPIFILVWFGFMCLPFVVRIYWRRMTKQERLAREWTIGKTIDLVLAALLISGGLWMWITLDNSGERFTLSSMCMVAGLYFVASVAVRFLYPLTFDDTPEFVRAIQRFVFNLLERLGA